MWQESYPHAVNVTRCRIQNGASCPSLAANSPYRPSTDGRGRLTRLWSMNASRTTRPEATSRSYRMRDHGSQDRDRGDRGITASDLRPRSKQKGGSSRSKTEQGGTTGSRSKGGERQMAEVNQADKKLRFIQKPEKVIEALLYIAHKRPNLDHYQAVKLLYLADKEHLNRYGRPITFDTYYALPYGPVGTLARDLLTQNRITMRRLRITALPFETEKLDKIFYIRAPNRPVNHILFSKSDLRVLDEIIASHGDMTFQELYDETHRHFAYRNAWTNRASKSRREEMAFEDMIDESPQKRALVDDLMPVAPHMK
jgi:uncharacterized phage-associated protein